MSFVGSTAAPPPTRLATCWGCIALALGVVAAVVASFAYLAVDYRQLFSDESLRLMAKFVREFFPPDLTPAFLAKAAGARCRPSPSPRSAPCSRSSSAPCSRCRPRAAPASRRAWPHASCSTSCAACPSSSGRR